MQEITITIASNFSKPISWLDVILQNLDPSLFQNITLGVLAIFIPFAIVFLTDILNSKNKKKRSEFEKMVLSDEVLGTKKVFWLAIISIIFFAFFSGTDISTSAKIISIFAVFILVILFWSPFKNILRFSEGYKPEFEIPFLKKLSFSKILKYRNKTKAEKMVRAWSSFWSEKSEFNEGDFIKIFISHINDAMRFKELELAIQLSQTYVNNIEKRDRFLIGHEILPKVLEWNEKLWAREELWLKNYGAEKRIPNFFSQKHFPTFRSWVLKIYKKTNSKRDRFWNWHYFGGEFFQAITKTLLKNGHGPYQFFSLFKKYIEKSIEKLNKIEDKKEKDKYDNYIIGLFTSFCPTFFDGIDSTSSNYGIWKHDFPAEWKISIENTKSGIPRVILREFLQWSRDRIFKNDNESNFDKSLTEVIRGIFPNVHSSLFTAFLMLFFSGEVKYALEKEPNFYISGTSISWSGSVDEDKGTRDKRLAEMMNAKAESQKEETIQIIFNYFGWDKLKITLDDDNREEWNNANDKKKKEMLKVAQRQKLEKMKTEIESTEIKEMCKNNEQKELYRKEFLELVELLLKEIEK
ncbi:MAG: hypothetical protein KAI16_02815 [Candidatus Pacebacteria bacterium]|nr:hypothetical protein [Candidatus Paceibacterota bacterium]